MLPKRFICDFKRVDLIEGPLFFQQSVFILANYIRIHFCNDLKVKLSFTYTLVNFICIFCLSQKCYSQDFSAIGFGTSVFSEVQLSGCGSDCSQTPTKALCPYGISSRTADPIAGAACVAPAVAGRRLHAPVGHFDGLRGA